MGELNRSIGWANRQITSAEETQQFLREMQQIVDRLEDGDATSVDVSTSHYAGSLRVEATLEARFGSFEDIPTELINQRDWDTASTNKASPTGYKLRLKDRV